MDPSEMRPSPRRELQGPRPTPLRVNKDSHRIKKPPVAPPHHHQSLLQPPRRPPLPPPPQQPVIIYTVSPKIIHTKPSEFMTLVQRLTGANSSSSSSTAAAEISLVPSPAAAGGGALSPAARIASFERSAAPSPRAAGRVVPQATGDGGGGVMDQWSEINHRPASFPGILSPVPAALPPISPNLFSPSMFDPSVLSLLHELSPVFASTTSSIAINSTTGTRSSAEGDQGSFLTSPLPLNYNLLLTPTVPSPGAFWDLLSQFPDT